MGNSSFRYSSNLIQLDQEVRKSPKLETANLLPVSIIENLYIAADAQPVTTAGPIPPCPYPGLAYFGPLDKARFFGREVAIGALERAVARRSFTVLVGAWAAENRRSSSRASRRGSTPGAAGGRAISASEPSPTRIPSPRSPAP